MTGLSLKDAYRALRRELDDEKYFKKYYVARGDSTAVEIINRIEFENSDVKILMCGHKGSGRFTEIFRIKYELDSYLCPIARVKKNEKMQMLNAADVYIKIAESILKDCDEKNVAGGDVNKFLSSLPGIYGVDNDISTEGANIPHDINRILGKMSKREQILNRFKEQCDKAITALNDLVASINKECVVMVDLGNNDFSDVRRMLNSEIISDANMKMVITCPLSISYTDVEGYIYTIQNLINDPKEMMDIVYKRCGYDIISQEIIEYAFEKSGRNIDICLNILSESIIKAATEGSKSISMEHVRFAIDSKSKKINSKISKNTIKSMKEALTSGDVLGNEDTINLLDEGLIIRDANGNLSIHPMIEKKF